MGEGKRGGYGETAGKGKGEVRRGSGQQGEGACCSSSTSCACATLMSKTSAYGTEHSGSWDAIFKNARQDQTRIAEVADVAATAVGRGAARPLATHRRTILQVARGPVEARATKTAALIHGGQAATDVV